MERLTNKYGGVIRFNDANLMVAIIDKLKRYEDTGLTPEEIKTLKEQLDILRAEVQELSRKLVDVNTKADYWEREAKKWCSKLGEIRGWIRSWRVY